MEKNDAYEFAGTGNINLFTSLTSTGTHIFSIYAKGNVGDSFRVYKSNGFSYAQNTITIDTTEWKRYHFTRDFSSTNGIIFIDSFSEGTISLWGAQVEEGSYATSYIPTSGSAVTRIADVCNNGANQFNAVHILNDATTFNKIAIKYKQNDFALWVNGIEVATDTNGSVFSEGSLDKLSYELNGIAKVYAKTKDLRVYNTALTDQQLQQLTKI